MAACCGLQVVEPVGSLGREGNFFWCAVLLPCVDAAVAGQALNLVSCVLDADVEGFLPVGRADGQPGAGDWPVVWIQDPVRDFGPLRFQCHVLEDWGSKIIGLAVNRPPVEPEAITLRIL